MVIGQARLQQTVIASPAHPQRPALPLPNFPQTLIPSSPCPLPPASLSPQPTTHETLQLIRSTQPVHYPSFLSQGAISFLKCALNRSVTNNIYLTAGAPLNAPLGQEKGTQRQQDRS